ncbi:hypothetical protein HYPSUDRAFT_31719 [Hypholoma sublateritium FD-334 SS-4]|uniref:Uncharacterized protein n=1 Tax=Hypholoma sublateritium (strain FD-334 SS-4) TaxID=945553 RepID=A0A0D2N025_HYPSF|nr:hypothetical protein HYPSUDRAFT_31719 [Hypholoma sublateritium FD-334 SS-4]
MTAGMVPVRASELAQTPIFGTPRRFTFQKRRHGACAGTAARTGAACNRQDFRAPTTGSGRLCEHRSSRGLRSSFHPFWIHPRRIPPPPLYTSCNAGDRTDTRAARVHVICVCCGCVTYTVAQHICSASTLAHAQCQRLVSAFDDRRRAIGRTARDGIM